MHQNSLFALFFLLLVAVWALPTPGELNTPPPSQIVATPAAKRSPGEFPEFVRNRPPPSWVVAPSAAKRTPMKFPAPSRNSTSATTPSVARRTPMRFPAPIRNSTTATTPSAAAKRTPMKFPGPVRNSTPAATPSAAAKRAPGEFPKPPCKTGHASSAASPSAAKHTLGFPVRPCVPSLGEWFQRQCGVHGNECANMMDLRELEECYPPVGES
ncbi:hypothetical protein GTA08_BOTSDO13526 [Botryosphaeria dothidea]|uniref:Uncharacterized protein n=1 Tax=Botryosphaeria dothidea TaxID=55169 RepID=A0A8H4ND44_9PEZI|nr:hypothetical protein GTA08_BOTSDO13526 [Botryosphaeria dothidea]